jgi:hypothetical protein
MPKIKHPTTPRQRLKAALQALEEAAYWLDDHEDVKAVERIMRRLGKKQ